MLIVEANALLRRYGNLTDVRRLLQSAVMADLKGRRKMERLKRANLHRRSYGPFAGSA